jgi:two-component system CheB/CheR fusion protein
MLDMTRILLVDDSEDVLYLLRLQLESIGYAIDAATDATAALEVAQRTPPDVIVSDLRMPDIDGLEFIRRVRHIQSLTSVPAIALTGATSNSDVQQAICNGFTAHLEKPTEASDLSKLIEQLTARRAHRKAG